MDPRGRMLAQGREAEIFAAEGGAVLKLYRDAGMGHEAEAAALTAISATGGPAPRLLGRVAIDGRPGLLIERIDGIDMLAMLSRSPWKVVALARRLAESHLAVHRVRAPPGLPDLRAMLELRIRGAPVSAELRSFALTQLDALPDGDRLCHGDFHPGNVLVFADDVSVIDWTNASRGDPTVDHARSAMLLSSGDPPPGVSRVTRAIVAVGRGLFSAVYARTYARGSTPDPEILRRARIAHVAARFSEGIEVEAPKLTAFLERAARS